MYGRGASLSRYWRSSAKKIQILSWPGKYSYPHNVAAVSPWDYLSTLERVAAISYKHTYFSPCSTFEIFGKSLGYGNAIISKYPLAKPFTHYTGGLRQVRYDKPSVFGGNGSRNFQHATVTLNTGKLHLVNHHAHWADQPLGDETSTQRLGQVASFVSSLKGPIVTVGDFNVSPTSPAMTAFMAATGLKRYYRHYWRHIHSVIGSLCFKRDV